MKKGLLSKRIWVIILVATAILLTVGGTVAIYTSQVYQRAVVRNRYNDVIRFSSDKLYRVMNDTDPQPYYYPLGKTQQTMTFSVCNYDQANNTLFCEKEIDYKITFVVKNGTDGFDYTVSCGTNRGTLQNNGNLSMEGSLAGGKRSVDTYSVTFDENDFQKVEIEVMVTPKDPTITHSRILNGVLIPIEYAATQGVRLNSEFTDKTRGTPQDFDAYNLLVSVSGGTGNALITWDHTKLDIDPFFVASAGVTNKVTENEYTTITVPMNSENETGTYLISFYNHNNTKPAWTGWTELPIEVKLEESASQPTEP